MSFAGNVALAAGSSAAAWLAAPLVSAAVHGTTDQRTLAAWKDETGPIPLPRLDGRESDGHEAPARHA
ncbi:hypothetical protein [Actinomycetospora sp. TBRC 11914]|uniref:hypothetical protein n=1 Tax=Actinomycetospora sp. TBRC 11914 TaxID=2729387 RepID=UPI00145E3C3E|nr:hypothetical protein [Actinomycetospora sp. TBRC 11914]NMO92506.1 hypothetical protein [Actinomycetospora sp. TBRC 11914]